MTLKIALLLIGLPLLAFGGHGVYHTSRNRTQTAMSCEQFAEQRPSAAWVRVTGCELDYVHAGYRVARGRIAELYFPVRLPQSAPSVPVRLVAVTDDSQALAIAEETIGSGRRPDQEAYLVMMLRIVTTLRASSELDGTIRTSPLSTRRALEGIGATLAPDVAVIDLHERPTYLWPGIQLGLGLVALLAFIYLFGRRPGEPAPAEKRRLPALMLLNLPTEATPADIERAPALGNREEVVKRVTDAVKGVKFKDGRGVLQNGNVRLTIDLGDGDLVTTAVVHAQGDAAAEPVRALLRDTGWRAYVPKRGAFVTPEQIDEIATS